MDNIDGVWEPRPVPRGKAMAGIDIGFIGPSFRWTRGNSPYTYKGARPDRALSSIHGGQYLKMQQLISPNSASSVSQSSSYLNSWSASSKETPSFSFPTSVLEETHKLKVKLKSD